MFVKWLHDMCKPFDELLIVPHQVQKGLDFHVISGKSELVQSKFSLLGRMTSHEM